MFKQNETSNGPGVWLPGRGFGPILSVEWPAPVFAEFAGIQVCHLIVPNLPTKFGIAAI